MNWWDRTLAYFGFTTVAVAEPDPHAAALRGQWLNGFACACDVLDEMLAADRTVDPVDALAAMRHACAEYHV